MHKMKICLKELRETKISLTIIKRKPLLTSSEIMEMALKESDELIAIFVKSIKTALINNLSKNKK